VIYEKTFNPQVTINTFFTWMLSIFNQYDIKDRIYFTLYIINSTWNEKFIVSNVSSNWIRMVRVYAGGTTVNISEFVLSQNSSLSGEMSGFIIKSNSTIEYTTNDLNTAKTGVGDVFRLIYHKP
jgi:hypothetical protein